MTRAELLSLISDEADRAAAAELGDRELEALYNAKLGPFGGLERHMVPRLFADTAVERTALPELLEDEERHWAHAHFRPTK